MILKKLAASRLICVSMQSGKDWALLWELRRAAWEVSWLCDWINFPDSLSWGVIQWCSWKCNSLIPSLFRSIQITWYVLAVITFRHRKQTISFASQLHFLCNKWSECLRLKLFDIELESHRKSFILIMDATLKSFLYVYFAQQIHQSHSPLRLKVRKNFTLLRAPLYLCKKRTVFQKNPQIVIVSLV